MASRDRQPARGIARYNSWMRLLDLTLPTPEENLALDEALLESAESEVLRLWESPTPMVVVGRASKMEEEVNVDACRAAGVPILRRHSGGATIVAGPGCLMYAVVLSYQLRPHLRMIDQAHRFVLETLASGLRDFIPQVQSDGISDLTLAGGMKFSGNALRCGRTHLLYHGTLLFDFPLPLIDQLLLEPPRQPDYRQRRSHREFVANLTLPRERLREAVLTAWRAANEGQPLDPLEAWPVELTNQLAVERYSSHDWNWQR